MAEIADGLAEVANRRVNGRTGPEPAESFCRSIGYLRLGRGGLAVRAETLERLARQAHKRAAKGPFPADDALRQAGKCGDRELAMILPELGFAVDPASDGLAFLPPAASRRAKRKRGKPGKTRKGAAKGKDSPFAKLQELTIPT